MFKKTILKKKETVVYTHKGVLLGHKTNETLPFATTRMDLKDIMLSQTQTNTLRSHLYVGSKTNTKKRK